MPNVQCYVFPFFLFSSECWRGHNGVATSVVVDDGHSIAAPDLPYWFIPVFIVAIACCMWCVVRYGGEPTQAQQRRRR